MIIRLSFQGQLKSGKNHMRIDPRTGRHFPEKSWAEWRDNWVGQAMEQRPREIIKTKVAASVQVWHKDRRRRDVPGLMDALWHVLERGFIVADDALICNLDHWVTCGIDRERPRVDIVLRVLAD